ncbi:MAG TPA: hypothetical protein VEQ11_12440 [Chloroflexota bacterium]|nr:hypothetical protein [Chloroflexota bacterium]
MERPESARLSAPGLAIWVVASLAGIVTLTALLVSWGSAYGQTIGPIPVPTPGGPPSPAQVSAPAAEPDDDKSCGKEKSRPRCHSGRNSSDSGRDLPDTQTQVTGPAPSVIRESGASPDAPAIAPPLEAPVSSTDGATVTITTPAGTVQVSVPAGGAPQDVTASLQRLDPTAAPALASFPPEMQLGGTLFQLEFRDPTSGEPVATLAQVTVALSQADLAALEVGSLRLAVFDGTSWTAVPAIVDPTTQTISATLTLGSGLIAVVATVG